MGEGRVVGKNAWGPGMADCPFALLFVLNVVFVVVFFFIWVGGGCEGWPESDDPSALAGLSNETSAAVASASVLSAFYSLLFSLIWIFIYLGIMKVAALPLIIMLNLIVISLFFAFGGVSIASATSCKDWDDACSSSDQTWYYVGGIVLLVLGALQLLWLFCIRDRIVFTAKMLSAVAGVIAICPGVILIAFIFAAVAVVWWGLWGGAFMQTIIYSAGSDTHTVDGGTAVGILFGMLIVFFWGHKV